ncbi:MAG: ParB/RepB/Spo0J family partition protein [Clostridiales bacterium]|nr:ParB/RepB/Spo0J family partition protein [Clostridiales bacterium]
MLSIPLSSLVPNRYQPRRMFEPEALEELADSIRQHGLLQPISVRALERGRYELIAGERRVRAASMVGLKQLPAIVLEASEREYAVMALVENLQRADLAFFEEAEGIARLIGEHDLTQEEAASLLGKTQPTIANKLRLLRLSGPLREEITRLGLTERHARALLRLPDEQRPQALDRISAAGLTVAETERLVERMLQPTHTLRRKGIIKDVRIFFNTINRALSIMKESGVAADAKMLEQEDHYEYIIKIPKSG